MDTFNQYYESYRDTCRRCHKKFTVTVREQKLFIFQPLPDSHFELCRECRPYELCKCGKSMLRGLRRCDDCAAIKVKIHRERGGIQNKDGYVEIRYPEHPNARSSGYVLEHILVMEEIIGRLLTADETVHHVNGIRHDNHPKNLELWASNHPPGQRVVDLVTWAKELLLKYDPEALVSTGIKQ